MNLFFLTINILFLSFNFVKCNNLVDVRVKNGLIRGRKQSLNGREYNEFLGIPYAEPPVGPLRFKKPLPPKEWTEALEAYEWPDSCVHNRYASVEQYFSDRMSEDCLYLNIWSPIIPESNNNLKPVMFFIHGGGLHFGSSSENVYSGHVLASKGEVVVVTINYRLTVFGLLYSGTEDAPGNMALWDQALALEWVNDNIKYFGGDSNRITLFGESAGGWSTSLHILSPVTRNLFQNAIIMSGASINNMSVCDSELILNMWIKIVENVGCGDEKNKDQEDKKLTTYMIECLKELPAQTLADMPVLHLGVCTSMVVIDGQFVIDKPMNSIRSGDFKKDFNLMVGTTEDEGSLLIPLFFDAVKYDKHVPKPINREQAINDLSQFFANFFGINGKQEIEVYFTGLSDRSNSDLLRRTMGIAIGDYFLGCPTIMFAKLIYSMNPKNNVYQYYFNSKDGDPNKLFCSQWMGVCHFNDIYPVFGVPFYDPNRYTEIERQVSEKMIDIFSTFAKTGRPPMQESAEWQSYYKLNDNIIATFYEITNEPKPKTNFGINLKITECEYLWNKYLIENKD